MTDHWLNTERGREYYKPRRRWPALWTYLVGALIGAGIGIPIGLWIGGYL